MTWPDIFDPFSRADAAALAFLLLAWFGSDRLIEHPPRRRPSVSVMMAGFRRDWMREFVTRQPRIFDATIIDSLRQGAAFFASACLIAIGGGAALLSNPTVLVGVTADLTPTAVREGIELRLIVVLLFVADALLKFVWAHRLFGYCAVMMASVPNDPADPQAFPRASLAAEVNITAARNFNRGLRSIYFALAALAWLLGPVPMALATTICTGVLLRREFASMSRQAMVDAGG
jgi:uncharacterized membrane protein